MAGWRARGMTLAMVGFVAAGAFALAGAQAGASDSGNSQSPILECVFHDTGTGQYNALWGYSSTASSTVNLPVGRNNKFSPSPQDRGQPTSFSPGTHHNVFVVTWNGTAQLKWNLSDGDAAAEKSSKACASNPVPIAGGLPWYLIPLALLAIGIAGLGFCCRRYNLELW